MNIVDEAKLYSLIYLNFEALVVRRVVGSVMEKNWAHSVDPCQRQVLQFSVHLIDLLSILLRCNGFARIQKALMDQTVSRPPNRDHDLFLVQVWLWEVLWSFFLVQPLSWSSLQLRNGSLLFCRVREDDNAK